MAEGTQRAQPPNDPEQSADTPKGFTKSERVDYIKRLLRIEQAKAAEREKAGVANPSENSHKGRSDEATAQQFGISSNTMRRELFIADNADMLDPVDLRQGGHLRRPAQRRNPARAADKSW